MTRAVIATLHNRVQALGAAHSALQSELEQDAAALAARPRRNYLINGGFMIWQRGASFSVGPSHIYTADRWKSAAAGANITISRGFTNSSSPYLKLTGASGSTAAWIRQLLEGYDVGGLVGEDVTLTVRLKSTASLALTISILAPTVMDNWTSAVFVDQDVVDLPAATEVSVTATFNAGSDVWRGLGVDLSFLNGIPAGVEVEIYDVKLERGAVSTPFERRQVGEEFALCQRYYETGFTIHATSNPTISRGTYKATKRVTPTFTTYPTSGVGAVWATGADMFYQTAAHSDTSGVNWTASAEL